MTDHDQTRTDATPGRGAQTVVPVQADALQRAASILGESGYTPVTQHNARLATPGRAGGPAPTSAPGLSSEVYVPTFAPGVGRPDTRRAGAQEPVTAPPVTATEPPARKGWFARLLDALLRRS